MKLLKYICIEIHLYRINFKFTKQIKIIQIINFFFKKLTRATIRISPLIASPKILF